MHLHLIKSLVICLFSTSQTMQRSKNIKVATPNLQAIITIILIPYIFLTQYTCIYSMYSHDPHRFLFKLFIPSWTSKPGILFPLCLKNTIQNSPLCQWYFRWVQSSWPPVISYYQHSETALVCHLPLGSQPSVLLFLDFPLV